MFKVKTKILIATMIIFLINGCGNSNSSDINKRPSLNENNIVSTTTKEVVLSEDEFSGGVVKKDVKVVAQSENGTKAVETVIPEGTEFQNTKGEIVTTPPVIAVVQKESVEEVVSNGKVTTKNVVKSELKMVDANGEKIIPSKPIKVTMKAPTGTKAGDKVKVDIPNGATVNKKANQEKLIVVVVGSDGNINIMINPNVFKTLSVIVIFIEKSSDPIPITGGAGGN